MEAISITKNVRMSPQKVREVTREIQGMKALAAQAALAVVPRKSARLIAKTLKSAIANAEYLAAQKPEEHSDFDAENLVVKEAVVGDGVTQKRWQPKARGSAGPIHKRSSNIRIIVSDNKA